MVLRSWLSPKVAIRPNAGVAGHGLFATVDLPAGELVAAKAGHLIDRATLLRHADVIRGSETQIADDLFLAPLTPEELEASMMHVNHSCDPNLGLAGNMLYVAMRSVSAGEELTLDYAMYASATTQEFACTCRSPRCRGRITNQDWKNPELQARYRGYFSWYLARKIAGA
jgi:hypothetical protein